MMYVCGCHKSRNVLVMCKRHSIDFDQASHLKESDGVIIELTLSPKEQTRLLKSRKDQSFIASKLREFAKRKKK